MFREFKEFREFRDWGLTLCALLSLNSLIKTPFITAKYLLLEGVRYNAREKWHRWVVLEVRPIGDTFF